MKTIIVIPTYNEVENLELLIDAIMDLSIPDVGILIVDDDSPDGTGRLADEIVERNPGAVFVLHRYEDKSFGRALISGFRKAMELGAGVIMHMDADFSHPPRYIPSLLDALSGDVDIAIGSRYVQGGSTASDWHFLRQGLSKFANQIYVRSILGVPVMDVTGGYRAYKRAALSDLGLDEIRSNGYSFQVETIYRCFRLGFSIQEVPIHFPERIRGSSKMNWRIALEAALRVLLFRWQLRKLRPETIQ